MLLAAAETQPITSRSLRLPTKTISRLRHSVRALGRQPTAQGTAGYSTKSQSRRLLERSDPMAGSARTSPPGQGIGFVARRRPLAKSPPPVSPFRPLPGEIRLGFLTLDRRLISPGKVHDQHLERGADICRETVWLLANQVRPGSSPARSDAGDFITCAPAPLGDNAPMWPA
jgi:hypothetical protein